MHGTCSGKVANIYFMFYFLGGEGEAHFEKVKIYRRKRKASNP